MRTGAFITENAEPWSGLMSLPSESMLGDHLEFLLHSKKLKVEFEGNLRKKIWAYNAGWIRISLGTKPNLV